MKYFLLLFSLFLYLFTQAQDSVRYRVILIGDAGEMNIRQRKTLDDAAAHILPDKTSVLFLGDNIYPHGMPLPGSKEEKRAQEIISSQYKPMRAKGAPVYFIPGNHDWDRSGPEGLARIKSQWAFLEEQGDSLLKLVPRNGCPDPVAIPLTDSLTIVAFDSEWWLFPYSKVNPEAECDCKTNADIVSRLQQLADKNRHNVVLLASHHPFQTYGVHGGRFTLKDHIFPLTAVNKNLYIPLPGIGSLYPFLRSTFSNPEDVKHPLYRNMIRSVDGAFGRFPNLLHVSGHEHGLQFIKNTQVQIVSGAGAKRSNARKGMGSVYADATQGYVTVDMMDNNTLSLHFYTWASDTLGNTYNDTLLYTTVNIKDLPVPERIKSDSVVVQVHPSYAGKSGAHHFFFGKNYREEWAVPVTLPVLRLSELHGGLTPLQEGGGMQSKSLRLADPSGKEWVMRSVEKTPDALLPTAFMETFARDWLDDVTSAQHPFSALAVPPIAQAVKVPHAHPVIGVVSPDKNLGIHERKFAGLVMLLEEREPLGESDNTLKMMKNLQKDNDDKADGKEFLRARMLDALLGDWDRHADQWRWYNKADDKHKKYIGVPRDRDQVFHLTQGLIPKLASKEYVLPTLRNFDEGIRRVDWLLFKTGFINAYPQFQFSRDDWTQEAFRFQKMVTDSALEAGLAAMPRPVYEIRHGELLHKLKMRREHLPAAMDRYYRFIQKVADIRTSDKNERVKITGSPDGDLQVIVHKISKSGEIEEELMDKTYDRHLTKEVRIYTGNGNDSVILDNSTSSIKLRLIGGGDTKHYAVRSSRKKVFLYNRNNASVFSGDSSRIRKTISDDSLNTAFTPVNLYNTLMPLVSVGINADDGFILGAGFKNTRQEGFRKYPYAGLQQLLVAHSFSTNAYKLRYTGEWIEWRGKADLVIHALIKAPNNTVNFFGRGNTTILDKTGNYVNYHRTRFATYQLDPAFRWRNKKGSSVSIGPSLYYYRFDADDNKGRFINNVSQIGSYDSSTIGENKLHLGFVTQYLSDKRNSKILPQWGTYVNIRLQVYKGIGEYAGDFAQLIPEVALYKSIGPGSAIVIAERIGGAISVGKTAFYQSAFLGGQENLLGYRQYRFAGRHSLYNNLEMRIRLANIASYILPGQVGLSGFWDVGRVWEKNEDSDKWHSGVGGGIYFVPASIASFNFAMGYSREGWYPYFTMGFRF